MTIPRTWEGRSLLLILLLVSGVTAQDDMRYADFLLRDEDYFRAISEYKRIYFYTSHDSVRAFCAYQIGKAYYRSGKFASSIRYFDKAMAEGEVTKNVRRNIGLYLGLNYAAMGSPAVAEKHWTETRPHDETGLSPLYLALLEAQRGRWEKADRMMSTAGGLWVDSSTVKELRGVLQTGRSTRKKSPLFASLLSGVVPGSGQFYCGHAYDGIQAALLVGGFAMASFAAYRYDREFSDHYAATTVAVSITGIFHLANMVGAYRTAQYRNLHQKESVIGNLRSRILAIRLEP